MTWLDTPDPVAEKQRQMLVAMLHKEIDQMTPEQLALAISIARKARLNDARVLAALNPEPRDR
jgi:hypothetical protein